MTNTVTLQRIVADASLDDRRETVLAGCREALVRKARVEGYTINPDQIVVTYRPATGSSRFQRQPFTVVRLDAPALGERAR